MVNRYFIFPALRSFFFTALCLLPISHITAISEDPMSFCTSSCSSNSCNKKECQKVCKGIWRDVAKDQIKESPTQTDPKKQEAMLYSTPVAQCLGLELPPEKKDAKPLEPDPVPADDSSTGALASRPPISGLCAAAIRHEMGALNSVNIKNDDLREALSTLDSDSTQ